MSDDLAVKQNSSTGAFALGGAAVGAGAGAGLAKWANVGIPTKYKSWEDAVRDVNDEFVTKKIEKSEGDVKAAWERLKSSRDTIKEAEKYFNEAIPEALKDTAEMKDYLAKISKRSAEEESIINKIIEEARAGKIEGIDKNLDFSAMCDKIYELAKEGKFADRYKNLETLTKESDELLTKLVEKAETPELKEAVKALDNKIGAVTGARTGVKEALNSVIGESKKTALELIKKPNMWLTAVVGAAALGLLGALVAPKHKDS